VSLRELWDGLLLALGQSLAFFYDLIPSYGIAIVLLTVGVKLITLPLTVKQTRSQQAMQKLQPEIKRIQAKYRGDREKMNQEVMKIYQEHGVNPLGGCLPILLQMPVLFALFRLFQTCGGSVSGGESCPTNLIGTAYLPAESALRTAIVAGEADFLGMTMGVSPMQAFRIGILDAVPYFLVIALMAFTSWYQQKQMMAKQETPAPPQMQMMSRLMVFLFPVISVNLPVALSVYWTTSSVVTILQQWLMFGGRPGWLSRFPTPFAGRRSAEAVASDGQGGGPAPGVDGSANPGRPKGSGARKKRKRR
jgi:YidC/Oxa1 family membrane protein insertase